MIYFVNDQRRLNTEDIQEGTIQQLLDYFKDIQEIGLDIETEGFIKIKIN